MLKYEQAIRSAFDVVSTSGSEFLCRCPWHPEGKKPNLYVNGRRGVYLCHSCGAKGHMKRIVASLPASDMDDIRERLQALREPPVDPGGTVRSESWLRRFAFPHDFWSQKRGFSDETIEMFQLGYDPVNDRLTIPLRNIQGQLLGVIQRVLTDEKPKYRYPKGFPIGKHLFGQWLVQGRRKVALVEGSLDAVACWDARVPALALLGSRLTDDQRDVLLKLGVLTVVIMTDNDQPGRDAIYQIKEALTGTGIVVRVMTYRPYWNAKDPGELTPQQRRKAYHSAETWHHWEPNW